MKLRLMSSLAACAAIFACSSGSPSDSTSDVDADEGSRGDGDGDGDGDKANGTGGNGPGVGDGDGDGDFIDGLGGDGPGWVIEPPDDLNFSYDPTKDAERDTCVALKIEPEEVQLDLFLVLDRSGSMDAPQAEDSGLGDCNLGSPNNGSRWCNAINAIYGFASDPSSVDMGIAYSDFAFSDCAGSDMILPLDQITEADENGHLTKLRNALNAATTGSGTNTQGAVNTLIDRTAAHIPVGKRKTIAVLVTDGEPYLQPVPHQFPWQTQACALETVGVTTHLTALNTQLKSHFESTGIPTFVIGMDGVSAANLEILAAGAGAVKHSDNCISGPDCSYYSVGNGNPAVFKDALEKIRRSVLGCEYAIPSSSLGLSDLDSLLVSFSLDTGVTPVLLSRRDTGEACTSGNDYWVDFSGDEPVITLCEALCDSRGDGAAVDISLECEGN